MEAISGVFKTQTRTQNAVKEALKAGIPSDRVTLLTPGNADQVNKELLAVPLPMRPIGPAWEKPWALWRAEVSGWRAVRS